MFGDLGKLGDLAKMMKMAGEMKRKLPELQQKLAQSEYTAKAGGGMVSATVSGKLELVGLEIDPRVIEDADAPLLADMVKAAVAAAQRQAAEAAAAAMKELTGGMPLPPELGGLV